MCHSASTSKAPENISNIDHNNDSDSDGNGLEENSLK